MVLILIKYKLINIYLKLAIKEEVKLYDFLFNNNMI